MKDGAAHVLRVEGGWSAVLRVPNIQTEDVWITRLLREYGVVVQPGYFFDMPGGVHLIVSLITPPEIFAEGIAAIGDLTSRIIQG